MKKIVDLHHHLNTLPKLFSLRNKLQHHSMEIEDFIKDDCKTIINVAFYVSGISGFKSLKKQINAFISELSAFGKKVQIIRTKNDLHKDYQLGLLLHVESARCLKSPLAQIEELYNLGIRGIIPLHFKDNKLGTSCDDPLRRIGIKKQDNGLTDLGKKLVEKANQLNMWIDLSHTTDQTADDILEISESVMISHVGIRDLHPYKRNKPIDFMQKIGRANGVIGITPWQHLIGPHKSDYIKQFETLIDSGLAHNIAIGSDYGAPIKTHREFKSPYDLGEYISRLKNSEDILWNNAFNFFERVLPE